MIQLEKQRHVIVDIKSKYYLMARVIDQTLNLFNT